MSNKLWEHRPSVLVMDPDLDMAVLVTAILSDSGFLTTVVTDIPTLLENVVRLEPDVVLMDIKGYSDQLARDAVEWLSNRPNPIPIVMFTTSEQMADTVGVTSAGKKFVSVVRKPFNLQELIDKLQEAVAERVALPKETHTKPTPSVSQLLRSQGVTDIQEDPDREWVVFHDQHGSRVQIYWWEQANAYCISRIRHGSETLEDLGKTKTAASAVERALSL